MFVQNSSQITNRNYYKNNNCNNYTKQVHFYSSLNCSKTGTVSFQGINMENKLSKYKGCIIGGAIGDAFGIPVEFMNLKKIWKQYGEKGLDRLISNTDNVSKFSDDTQLTIFTAKGLLSSGVRDFGYKKMPNMKILFDSYKDWYSMCALSQKRGTGWISGLKELLSNGGSGKTCMKVLSDNTMGSIKSHINGSKTCGGVMRVAPIGLLYYKYPEFAFKVANECAAITHGHPNAYLSAGFYASLIASMVKGADLNSAIKNALAILKKEKHSEELYKMLQKAIALSKLNIEPHEAITSIGKGWNGDEAISMAIYAVLRFPNDYKKAIMCAANHGGDSDTVASIAGGISGTHLGIEKIPQEYQNKIQLYDKLIALAKDLYLTPKHIKKANQKYPTDLSKLNYIICSKRKIKENL